MFKLIAASAADKTRGSHVMVGLPLHTVPQRTLQATNRIKANSQKIINSHWMQSNLAITQLRERVNDDAKDDIQTDDGDNDEVRQIVNVFVQVV